MSKNRRKERLTPTKEQIIERAKELWFEDRLRREGTQALDINPEISELEEEGFLLVAQQELMKQRYFGFTTEPNDVDYIAGFIGSEKAKELRNLENGQFLYSFNGVNKLIQIQSHKQNIKPKLFQPTSLMLPMPKPKTQQTENLQVMVSLGVALLWLFAIVIALSQLR